jgi:membrane protein required for colicin V production
MGAFPITALDILITVVVLVSAGYAVYRGLIRETLSVFAWLVAIVLMFYFAPVLSDVLDGPIASPWLREPIAYIAVFLAAFIPLSYVGHSFREAVEKTPIGAVDRTLGFIYGVGRGVVVVSAVYLVFAALVPLQERPAWLTEARLYPLVQNTGGVLRSLVPGSDTAAEVEAAATARRPAPSEAEDNTAPSYGADDRQELDRLIENTGER